MKFLKLFFLCILINLFVFKINISLSNEKINYIDMDLIMNTSLAGKSITLQLQNLNKLNSEKYKKNEEALQKEEKNIINQQNVLDKKEYEKKVSLFREKILKYNQEKQNTIKIFNDKKIIAQRELTKIVTPILSNYAKEKSISLIISKKNIVIGKTELDISGNIIKLLNENIKEIKLK